MPDLATLVLQAAVLELEHAVTAWVVATELEPIDDWPSELARPLPLVYLNVRYSPEVAHRDLLRGIYRAAWSANMVRLRRAIDVISEFDSQGIHYRLIKGTAVCALTHNWSARRMGDIDVVVPSARASEVRMILESCEFEHQVVGASIQGLWKSSAGGIIDLHVASSRQYGGLLTEEPQVRTVLGVPLRVPSPELSVCIAAHHAQMGYAASDYIQGLLDIHRLLPLCDAAELTRSLRHTHQGKFFVQVVEHLRNLGADPDRYLRGVDLETLTPSLDPDAKPPLASSQASLASLAARLSSPVTLANRVRFLRRSPTYLAWLSAGHIRPWEERVVRRAGGFLPPPPEPLTVGMTLEVTPRSTLTKTAFMVAIRIPGIEDRIRIRLPHTSRARIRFAPLDELSMASRMVFVNGTMQGYFPPFDASSVTIDVTPIEESAEISLRLHKNASQDDFAITVEMVK